MRRQISAALRKKAKAHLTWHVGPHGLALTVAERYVDMEPLAKAAPKNVMVVYESESEDEGPPQ